jgi:dipeptidyl aminopeptidase/acylaminoacyl peptidase
VDANRLGALGASYGGYSVYYLAGTHNNRFKAFAAHNGVFNFESMYGTTEELFFPNYDMGGSFWDSKWRTQAAYYKSPHKLVANWNTPILISVGEHDYRVPHSEGLQAFTAAQLQGVPSKLLFFPDETHFVAKPQNAALWHTELFDWFKTYLQK